MAVGFLPFSTAATRCFMVAVLLIMAGNGNLSLDVQRAIDG